MDKSGRWGWGLIIACAILILGMGTVGFLCVDYTPIHALYAAIQLFVLESSLSPTQQIPLALNIARFFAPIIMAATAIRAAMILLRKEISNWKRSRLSEHIVVCGLGRKGFELVRQFREPKKGDPVPVVVLEVNEDNPYITASELIGAHILLGNGASRTLLKNARIRHASQLYLMTGDDGINLATLMKVAKLLKNEDDSPSKLKVWLHVKAFDICTFLRTEAVLENIRKNMKVEVISMHEVVSRNLLLDHIYPIVPVDKDDRRVVHLAIAGFGRLGKTLATRAIRMLVLPNNTKLKITVIDREAEAEVGNLKSEHKYLEQFCDLEWKEGNIEFAQFRNEIVDTLLPSEDTQEMPFLIFCVDDAYINVSAALYIAQAVWKRDCRKQLPICVRMTEAGGWHDLIRSQQKCSEWVSQIHGFGSIPDDCRLDILTQDSLDQLAKGVHSFYQAKYPDPDSPSCKDWDAPLGWVYKDSSRQAADHIHMKLRMLGLQAEKDDGGASTPWPPDDTTVGELSQLEHRRWVTERTMAGWEPGKTTIREKCISKDLVDWKDLDKVAMDKDRDHVRDIAAILKQAGMKITAQSS